MPDLLKNIAALGDTDFGVSVVYKTPNGRYSISGIFDNAYQSVDIAEVGFSSSAPLFTFAAADLPCRPSVGDFLYLNADRYTVRNFRQDGTGIMVLQLEYATQYELPEFNNLMLQDGGNMQIEAGPLVLLETGN